MHTRAIPRRRKAASECGGLTPLFFGRRDPETAKRRQAAALQSGGKPPRGKAGAVLGLLLALAVAGCNGHKRTPVVQDKTVALPECIALHNANADKVEHLWIHCDVDFKMESPPKPPLLVPTLEGLLIYRPPRELVLKADSLRGTEVFFGSNNDEYWMWSKQEDALRVGTWAKFGTPGTAVTAIAAPEIFWMLGIYPIRGTPILSYTRDDRYRYVRFHEVVGGRQLRVLRELVFDRIDHWLADGEKQRAFEKDRIVKVRTYSLDGTLMAEASCDEYEAAATATGEALIPTRFTLAVRKEGITLTIALDADELPDALTHAIRDAYFKRRPAPVGKCIDLDAGGKQVPCP